MDMCLRCREGWFNMKLKEGVCERCLRNDRDREIQLFGFNNNMDPGDMPDLPVLTQIEEMLIARVHVFVEVRQVRGQQYKYSGHVVNFLRNTGKIYDKLPLLPPDLEMVLLRPSNTASNPRLNRQFVHDFKVRRDNIVRWLHFLRVHHPGYRTIEIEQANIDRLPLDGNVMDDIMIKEVEADIIPLDSTDAEDEELPPETVAVPNLLASEEELGAIRQQLGVPTAAIRRARRGR
jgi:hypothetical protein